MTLAVSALFFCGISGSQIDFEQLLAVLPDGVLEIVAAVAGTPVVHDAAQADHEKLRDLLRRLLSVEIQLRLGLIDQLDEDGDHAVIVVAVKILVVWMVNDLCQRQRRDHAVIVRVGVEEKAEALVNRQRLQLRIDFILKIIVGDLIGLAKNISLGLVIIIESSDRHVGRADDLADGDRVKVLLLQ